MKKHLVKTTVFIALFALLEGCEGSRSLPEINPSVLYFPCGIPALNVVISAAGKVEYSVIATPSWLSVTPSSSSGVYSLVVTAAVAREGLYPGQYSEQVIFNVNGHEMEVTAVVDNCGSEIYASPARLKFSESDVELPLRLYSFSDAPVNWVASTTATWLELSPVFGTLSEGLDIVNVRVNRSGLSPGSYTATISISGPVSATHVVVEMVKADHPVLFFPQDPLIVDACSDSVTLPVINLGSGSSLVRLNTSSPLLSPEQAWMFSRPDAFAIPLVVDRSAFSPDAYQVSITISDAYATYGVDANVKVQGQSLDWLHITRVEPPQGVVTPSSSLNFSFDATSYIETAPSGGYLNINVFSSDGNTIQTYRQNVSAGLVDSTVSLSLTGLAPGDYPLYIAVQLVSNTGSGVPGTVLVYPVSNTYYVLVKNYSFSRGWRARWAASVTAVLEYNLPYTATVGLWLLDQWGNTIASWSTVRYGNGTTTVSLDFNANECTKYLYIEGRVYGFYSGNLLARNTFVEERWVRFSDVPDRKEPNSLTSPADAGTIDAVKVIEGNFHAHDENDAYVISLTPPGWFTFYTLSRHPFPEGVSLSLWDEAFTTAITSSSRRDPVFSDAVISHSFTAPVTVGVLVYPLYSWRGSGSEYSLVAAAGKITATVTTFAAAVTESVIYYTATVTNTGTAPAYGAVAGVYIDEQSVPSQEKHPDLYKRVDISSLSSQTISFSYPCPASGTFNSYFRIWAGDSDFADNVTGPVQVVCPDNK